MTTMIPTAPAAIVAPSQPYGQVTAPPVVGRVPVIPDVPIMRPQTYSAAMSYIGITRRTTAWIRKMSNGNPAVTVLAISLAVVFLLFMYFVVTVWYFFTLFLFGWLLFPFRLMRRSSRKQEHLQRQQLATMQAMLIQQQQMQTGPQPASSSVAPAWFTDSQNPAVLRWWDGQRYTEHTRPA